MDRREQSIGGLWKREGETNGKKWCFHTGSIKIDGKDYKIKMNKNFSKKEGDKFPDYQIFFNDYQPKSKEAAVNNEDVSPF